MLETSTTLNLPVRGPQYTRGVARTDLTNTQCWLHCPISTICPSAAPGVWEMAADRFKKLAVLETSTDYLNLPVCKPWCVQDGRGQI